MNPESYRIIIVPLSVDAEARLKYEWAAETEHLAMSRKPASDFYKGFIDQIPFEIRNAE